MNELQAASKKMILRSGRELNLEFNYDADSFARTIASNYTNQFLTTLDFFSQTPEDLNVKISSANFGHGTYPKISKHRWLVRTVSGYHLNINFDNVDIESSVDEIRVYNLKEHNTNSKILKTLVTKVTSATTVSVESNSALITLSTTECSRHHRGFNATVNVNKYDVTTDPKGKLCFYY